jgi:hypothetical protein
LAAFDSLSFRRCDKAIHLIRRDTIFQGGGGDVRGTPAQAAFALLARSAPDTFPSDAPDGFSATTPDTPVPVHSSVQPSGTSVHSHWYVLCDQAQDHCRYLRTCATG